MTTLAILDLETTGLNTTNDKIIDIGVLLVDVTDNQISVVRKVSCLVKHKDVIITPDIEELTRITNKLVDKHGVRADEALPRMLQIINSADYVVAHNGINFDYPMLENNLISLTSTPASIAPHKVDSCVDVPYPERIKTRKLSWLLAEHGIAPNPHAHRAISDCESLLSLLMCYDINKVIERSHEPSVTLRAIIHRDENDLARGLGFRWTDKKWIKTVKKSEVETVRKLSPFPVV